jgi:hypothetical protein
MSEGSCKESGLAAKTIVTGSEKVIPLGPKKRGSHRSATPDGTSTKSV